MRYLSVCSGIEAATCAWRPLGWHAFAFSEVAKFPSAVLEYHYPHVPNLGDMTRYQEWPDAAIDVLVGGTPCQSFSVAGLRKGLDDPRGNLMLTFGAIAAKYRPEWLVWENVPGVLSSNGGRDFGTFLGMLAELGYGFAYRILDAQYFGVAQRRRRVFVVGHFGDWRRAAAVLFERASLSGHPAPRRKTWPSVAALTATGVGTCGADDNQAQAGHLIPSTGEISHCLNAGSMGRLDYETETLIAFGWQNSASQGDSASEHITPTLDKSKTPAVATLSAVRRLTTVECERLQGFRDNYTRIPWRGKPASECPDGPRYKAIGNSMAVPKMHWIGKRIQAVSAIQSDRVAA